MRKISWSKYTSVLIMTILVFVVGILIAYIISSRTSEDITDTQKDIRNYLLSLNLQSEIASEYICQVDVFELTKDKTELGKRIDILEKNLGKGHDVVQSLKLDYSLLSIRQWLLVKKFKEECDKDVNIVLFFYSNKVNIPESESQGYVLDYIYEKYSEEVVIYAFDIDENTPALNTIKTIYQVTKAPSVVINENLFTGLQTKQEIESSLN